MTDTLLILIQQTVRVRIACTISANVYVYDADRDFPSSFPYIVVEKRRRSHSLRSFSKHENSILTYASLFYQYREDASILYT